MNHTIEPEHLQLIQSIAKRFVSNKPRPIDWQDYITSGYIGLQESLDRFNTDMGVTFETFAGRRILGAMQDQFRREHGRPHRVIKNKKKTGEVRMRQLNTVAMSQLGNVDSKPLESFVSVTPLDEIAEEDNIRRLLDGMSRREQMIAAMSIDGMSCSEIGAAVGISSSLVSIIKTRRIAPKLRQALGLNWETRKQHGGRSKAA